MPLATVQTEGFAYGGEAFGRLADGRICFFRGGVPGEDGEVELVYSKRSFARGLLRRVTAGSPERRIPVCPLAARPGKAVFCPGCSFQQVDYSCELKWKQSQLTDFLVRAKVADISVMASPIPAPARFGWRNRLKLSCRDGKIGFFAEDNRSIVAVDHCPIAVGPIDAALADHRDGVDGESFFRWTAKDGVVVGNDPRELTEELEGFGVFSVPASSFFQTNSHVAAQLARGAVDMLRGLGISRLLELYCGVGVFSLCAAGELAELRTFGVELDATAIDCAVRNARRRGVSDRCRFVVGNAEKWPRPPSGFVPDAVLVDPPRRGLSERLVEALKRWRVPHIVYISCAPDTLTRDLRRLAGCYRTAFCRLYDMFPATGHFETLVRLDLQ